MTGDAMPDAGSCPDRCGHDLAIHATDGGCLLCACAYGTRTDAERQAASDAFAALACLAEAMSAVESPKTDLITELRGLRIPECPACGEWAVYYSRHLSADCCAACGWTTDGEETCPECHCRPSDPDCAPALRCTREGCPCHAQPVR